MKFLKNPIKWITFDVTDTLIAFYPSVSEIYYHAAVNSKLPLPYTSPNEFKITFKAAYKQVLKEYPCFGYHTRLSERDWWKKVVDLTLDLLITELETIKEVRKEGNTSTLSSVAASVSAASPLNLSERDRERYFRLVYQSFASSECYHVYDDVNEFFSYFDMKFPPERRDLSPLKLGIVTNSTKRTVETTLPVMNLHKHFLFFLCSTDCGFMKPDSQIFQKAFEEMRFLDSTLQNKNEILYIGNQLQIDYYGAINAGYQAVLIGKFYLFSSGCRSQITYFPCRFSIFLLIVCFSVSVGLFFSVSLLFLYYPFLSDSFLLFFF
jgi:HAD superfamily hydrolase (TIGR01549 family)